MKYKERTTEPSMQALLAWGYDARVTHDFTSHTGEVRHRIRKTDSKWLTEAQDNYRRFHYSPTRKAYLFNYLDDGVNPEGKPAEPPQNHYLSIYGRDYSPERAKTPAAGVGVGAEHEIVQSSSVKPAEEKGPADTLERDFAGKAEQRPDQHNGKTRAQNRGAEGGKSPAKETRTAAAKASKPDQSRWVPKGSDQKRRPQSAHPGKASAQKARPKAGSRKPAAAPQVVAKPPFHAYGRGNTKPTVGGTVYGQYLLSHNLNPEFGNNEPRYQQVYAPAQLHGSTLPQRQPTVNHKVQEEMLLTTEQMEEVQQRNPIMPYERGSPQRTQTRTRMRNDAPPFERSSTTVISAPTEPGDARKAAPRPPSDKQGPPAEPIFTPVKETAKQRTGDPVAKEGDRPHSLFHQPEAAGERLEASAP